MELRNLFLRKLIVFVIVAAIAIPFISPEIFAATKITAEGGEHVAADETFTVKVTYGGDEQIGRVDGYLTYDTSKLEYISGGTSEGDTGYVQMKLAGTDGTITFTLKFKALEAGSTSLEIFTNEIYDFAEIPLDTPSLSKNIDIEAGGGAAKDTSTKEEANSNENELTKEDVAATDPQADEIYQDEDFAEEQDNNLTMILIGSAAVLVLLIIVISVVLRKRK